MDIDCDPQNQIDQDSQTTVVGPIIGPLLPTSASIPLPAPPLHPAQQQQQTSSKGTQSHPIGSELDIDSLLLQQFSCMGTTDHDDLIKQFQSLMNNQMNEDSARFFLEMSNW